MRFDVKKLYTLLHVAFALLCVSACSESGCPLNNVVLAHYGFYSTYGDTVRQVELQAELTVRAMGTDSILLNKEKNPTGLNLPLSFFAEADTLIFDYMKEDTLIGHDTIIIAKTNQPHYESPDCPSAMFHVLGGVEFSRHAIDTIIITSPSVNYSQDENIRIVFAGSD